MEIEGVSMMVPRTTKPEPGNKYYISSRWAGKKGWNPCVLGNDKIVGRDPSLNVLPNCVGWAVGRFNEIIGQENCDLLYIIGANNNAKNLTNIAQQQGLKVGTEPRPGAAIVWSSTGCGHVAIVESITGGAIRISQSGWDTTAKARMWFATHQKGDGNWIAGDDYYWMRGKYKFKGFIYQPEEDDTVTQEQFNGMMNTWLAEQRNQPAQPYAENDLAWAKATGIMVGDKSGNQMPRSFTEREDDVIMLHRLYDLINKEVDRRLAALCVVETKNDDL